MKTALIPAGVLIVAALVFYMLMPASSSENPSNDSEAKIDINTVCDGALAYMTFENGAAAEAWVAECKRGEHPEAIEQWKVQMGITDDRAI